MKPTLEQVIAFAQSDLAELQAKPPTPYEIALAMGGALLASGRCGDDFTAAMQKAWLCVVPFYEGVKAYENDIRTRAAIAGHVASSPVESDMTAAEARAYVTGGETGQIGEFGVVPAREDEIARFEKIRSATLAAQSAAAAVEEAEDRLAELRRAPKTKINMAAKVRAEADVETARAAFQEACEAQSAAYL